jgi:putative hydrolase of the HAD superfamily
MIKAILFDFDGVLTIDKTGSTSITDYISKACDLPLKLVEFCYYKYNKALLYGEITHEEIWNEFCNDLGKTIAYRVLVESFIKTALDMKMIDLVKQLKERYLIGMVTDNKCDRIDKILDYHNLRTYFNVVAVSAKQHSGKDSCEIFQYVINNLRVDATECIFIDNTEKNLIIPSQMGMKTILFDDENRDIDMFKLSLDNLLV